MRANEKEILNIIRYFPSFFVIIISVILTLYLYYENQKNLKIEIDKLESNYISLNKDQTKYHIKRLKEEILNNKESALKELKDDLKMQVNNSYKILNSIYEKNKHLPKEVILKKVKNVLQHISFNEGRSYIFIYTMDGKNVLHPQKKYLENKSLWDSQDVKGTYFMREMNKILSTQSETYYNWFWKKDDKSKKAYEKIGFFKKFEPLGVFLGSGEYINDFEQNLKQRILKNISTHTYKENDYVFVIDYEGIYLAYYNSEFIGKTVYEKSFNPNIRSTFETMKKVSSEGGFISYYHTTKPNESKMSDKNIHKYSYIDNIKDWGWIIGTGFYMDDFYKSLEEKKEELNRTHNSSIQKILVISFLLTLFILMIFVKVSNLLEDKFIKHQKDIRKQINENIKKDNLLAHQSKMAAMGEMIGNIAHQWRQPLSTISTIVTGLKLQKELGISKEEDELESLALVNKHAQYLSTTIDDFRSFFTPQKDAKKFYLSSALEKAITLVKVQFNSKSIEIEIDIDDVELTSIENELIQVLINILNNARDELIKIEGSRYIFVKTVKKNNSVEIIIKDNAGGIPNKVLPHLFEPYFTTKQLYNGTGIGLFMSQEIVEKHLDGKIFVSNDDYIYKENKYVGAIFKIILPLNIDFSSNLKKY